MAKYTIKLMQRASRDLDDIYNHIADDFKAIGTAEKMADALADAIMNLDEMPYRGSIRKTGAFANRGYRQLFVKNFTIVYRIDEAGKWSLLLLASIRQAVFNNDFFCGAMMSVRRSIYVNIFGIFSSCKQRVDLYLIGYAKASRLPGWSF